MITPADNSSLYRTPGGYQRVRPHYDRTFAELGAACDLKYVETSFGATHVAHGLLESLSPSGQPPDLFFLVFIEPILRSGSRRSRWYHASVMMKSAV
jgi:hypothetical protein